ncbi:MAG: glycosyltransferase [Candidatus Abawacabacteria bacterium]|nr:glycosyltransferase [Candidatus Abawacabacteria bacterium]
MKVALVNDWLTSMGGEMKVLLAIADIYPEAPIYTSVFDKKKMSRLAARDIRTSYLQKLPFATKVHKMIPMLRPRAFEDLDLSEFDVVISSSHAEAKGVITKPNTVHICYCHTPTRYYWSDYHEYKQRMEFGILNPLAKFMMPRAIHKLRQWDYLAAQRVDHFIANSQFVAQRIQKYYRRDAQVIYPPVNTEYFTLNPEVAREDFFFAMSRAIPYKKLDLLVQVANQAKVPLKVAGGGPMIGYLKKIAGPTVEILGYVSDEDMRSYMQRARAFLFAAEEDFGIVPVEAMACGTPVIAYGRGGVVETVTPDTGILVGAQTVDAFVRELQQLDNRTFDHHVIRKHAEQFSVLRFQQQMKEYVNSLLK